MRIVELREQTVPVSRYADPGIPAENLNTTAVALVTDPGRDAVPIGRYQGTSTFSTEVGNLVSEGHP